MNIREAFEAHIKELEKLAIDGDEFATKSLAAMALLVEGWRPGGPDDDGGLDVPDETVVVLAEYRNRLAA